MTARTSPLLADPQEVAAARALIVHARERGWVHYTYQFNRGPLQHIWRHPERPDTFVEVWGGGLGVHTPDMGDWLVPARHAQDCAVTLDMAGLLDLDEVSL